MKLEQYCTSAGLAAKMLTVAQDEYGDIEDKKVLDLGCGTGMLSCAAVMKGAEIVVAVDVDEDAIEQAKENAERVETDEEIVFINMDLEDFGKLVMNKRKEEREITAREAGKLPATNTEEDKEEVKEETKESIVEDNEEDTDEDSDDESDEESEDVESKILTHYDTVIMNPPFGTKIKNADIKFLLAGIALTDHVVYSLHKTSTIDYVLERAKKAGCEAEAIAQLDFDLPKSYKCHKEESRAIDVTLIRLVKKKKGEEVAVEKSDSEESDEESDSD